ncbi:4,5-dioxygenase [Shewanella canadensis]|uniref:4,5-dioxygenase n=1 Tax=Shewanella canadensis TaxID=271096 RepID=A0A431WW94_9GAMM|nr:DOPA 4,5-dioxygenase family protein [Shewanella canadensis]RTR39688.1 4,5-dioxygenase [Shewanella canadensis]
MTFPANIHSNYHAHLYFDETSMDRAIELRCMIYTQLGLYVGNLHTKLVGPHPKWSFEIAFTSEEFDMFLPWIDKHRNGLSVLLHPVTGDDLKDHTEYASWLGQALTLKLSIFTSE